MLTVSAGQVEEWMAQVFWPFVRVGSCLMFAPAFSAVEVPVRVRIVLAGAIAILIAPLVPPPPQVQPFSAAGMVITAQQVLIGAALGFALQLVFDAVSMGGQLLANSMGLSFAYNLDPVRGTGTPVVGQLYSILVTLTFLALDGHLRVLEVLVDGFRTLPLNTSGLGSAGLWHIVEWGSQIFAGALAIALPGMTALLIVNLAFGMISRAAPTLNLFAVGLPISLLFGLAIIMLCLPALQASFLRLLQQGLLLVQGLLAPGA